MDTSLGIALIALLTALVPIGSRAILSLSARCQRNLSRIRQLRNAMPSYRPPTLNLLCNIGPPTTPYSQLPPMGTVRLADEPCQLTYGRRVNLATSGGTSFEGTPVAAMSLLLGKAVDIRGPQDAASSDLVEVPAGSGRLYWVCCVDDIGRGFPNEHRFAYIVACAHSWTAPYP